VVRAALWAHKDLGSGLFLNDAAGKAGAVLHVHADKPHLYLDDAAGKTIWQAP